MAEADRMAAADLWPGFDPRRIPVAIFDGERTLLFHHPSPPADFQAVPGQEGVQAFSGRHPSVTANTSVDLGGVLTATVMPGDANLSVTRRGALVIHETFHAFQRAKHPSWSANEVELFTYPVDRPELLELKGAKVERAGQVVTVKLPG